MTPPTLDSAVEVLGSAASRARESGDPFSEIAAAAIDVVLIELGSVRRSRAAYGSAMQIAQQGWREWAISSGVPGSEFTIGPCAGMMVPCPCPLTDGHCEWCCGSKLVTERVLRAIEDEVQK